MEEHPELVSGRFNGDHFTKAMSYNLWEEIANRLNCEGSGAVKDVLKWKKCWTSWKSEVKGKAAQAKKKPTGGGTREDIDLTPLEIRLVDVDTEVIEEPQNVETTTNSTANTPSRAQTTLMAPTTVFQREELITSSLSNKHEEIPIINDSASCSKQANEGETLAAGCYGNLQFDYFVQPEATVTSNQSVNVGGVQSATTASSINRKRRFHSETLKASKKRKQDELSHFERVAETLKGMKDCKVEALQHIEKALIRGAIAKEELVVEEKSKAESLKEISTAMTSISQTLGNYFLTK